MKTNNTLVAPIVSVGLIKDGNGKVGVSLLMYKPKDVDIVLCALNEILEFYASSVEIRGSVGLLSTADARVRGEVLEKWRTKISGECGHIGYTRLMRQDLETGPHRLDLASGLK